MNSFMDVCEGYTTKYLKDKLTRHYGEQVIIINWKGRLENIVTFDIKVIRYFEKYGNAGNSQCADGEREND